jgi:hypothetical protein
VQEAGRPGVQRTEGSSIRQVDWGQHTARRPDLRAHTRDAYRHCTKAVIADFCNIKCSVLLASCGVPTVSAQRKQLVHAKAGWAGGLMGGREPWAAAARRGMQMQWHHLLLLIRSDTDSFSPLSNAHMLLARWQQGVWTPAPRKLFSTASVREQDHLHQGEGDLHSTLIFK